MTQSLGDLAALLIAAVFVATALERIIEAFVKPLLPDSLDEKTRDNLLLLTSLALGLLAAFGFALDLVTPTLESQGVTPAVGWAGMLLAGLVLGGGSNLIHELWPAK